MAQAENEGDGAICGLVEDYGVHLDSQCGELESR